MFSMQPLAAAMGFTPGQVTKSSRLALSLDAEVSVVAEAIYKFCF